MRSDITRIERQMLTAERQRASSDSAMAVNVAQIARLVQGLYDSLDATQSLVSRLRGDVRVELLNVQQQLVAIQELTGQSQQRLTELRGQLDDRFQQLLAAPPGGQPAGGQAVSDSTRPPAPRPDSARPAAPPAAPPATPAPGTQPTPDQLMDLSLQQLRRGSPATARLGLTEFLRRYPTHARAVDAEYFMGEAWAAERQGDSASAAYRRVVQRYATAPRAASAMYKLGLMAVQGGRRDEARTWFDRVIASFATSEEAALAREQLRTLTAPAPATPAPSPAPAPRRPPAS